MKTFKLTEWHRAVLVTNLGNGIRDGKVGREAGTILYNVLCNATQITYTKETKHVVPEYRLPKE